MGQIRAFRTLVLTSGSSPDRCRFDNEWAPIDSNPGYGALAMIFDDIAGEHAATFRSPYTLGEAGPLQSLFEDAGLTDVEVETVEGTTNFASVETLLKGEIDGSPLAGHLSSSDPAVIERVSVALSRFIEPDGRVAFPNPAVIARGMV